MNLLKNKWFILGNILLLLAVIPVTLFVVKQQQNVKSKAAPSTTLSLEPASVPTVDVGQTFDLQLMVDPGANVVAIINATITYPSDTLELVTVSPNTAVFPVTLKNDTATVGTIELSLTTGSEVTKAVQTKTAAATITFKAKAPTSAATPITITQNKSEAFSLATADGVTENVLSTVAGSTFTAQQASTSATPTVSPAPTGTDTGGGTGTNANPVCSSLGLDRDLTGVAPYSVVFTATGTDSDGTIPKATFNFGDGPATEVTTGGGIGTGAVSVQIAHTYNNPGSYTATATLTDNASGTSDTTTCTQTVTVTGDTAIGGGETGGAAPTPATPLQTGSTTTTIGIIGGIILTLIGGIALLTL